jgi:hypothetical protein
VVANIAATSRRQSKGLSPQRTGHLGDARCSWLGDSARRRTSANDPLLTFGPGSIRRMTPPLHRLFAVSSLDYRQLRAGPGFPTHLGACMKNSVDSWICSACVGRPFLREKVSGYGQLFNCSFCKRGDVASCPVTYLPQFIWPVLYNNYGEIHGYKRKKGSSWGEPIHVVLQKLAGVSEEAADCLRQAFLFLSTDSDEDWPGPTAFLETAQYLERGRDSELERVNFFWDRIKEEALHRTRYFNTNIEAILKTLLSDVHSAKTVDGKGLVRTFQAGMRFYRARVALSAAQLNSILLNPTRELGPPTGAIATAGRMNPSGIALFYGALEPETCLTEVRPPVGSRVVCGAFSLRRTVLLLDLTLSDEISLVADPFSKDYEEARLRWAFLRSLGSRLAEPIMPGSETVDYVPTQIVCEYISQFLKPKVDGIVYPSSQSSKRGKNVVLFFESSSVQQWHHSLQLHVSASTADDDQTVTEYNVWPEEPDVVDPSPWIINVNLSGTLSLLKSTIMVADVEAARMRRGL